jgi:DNA-binding response OmpR family regulator
MDTKKQEQIRRTLRSLAEVNAAMIDLMERALTLLNEELALAPIAFWRSRLPTTGASVSDRNPTVDHGLLSIRFRGRSCFLGNTLPFQLFARLVSRPNVYLPYQELLTEVWHGRRSDSAVRGVVKRLREKLRQTGMTELAKAIDGTVPGHYALKLGG